MLDKCMIDIDILIFIVILVDTEYRVLNTTLVGLSFSAFMILYTCYAGSSITFHSCIRVIRIFSPVYTGNRYTLICIVQILFLYFGDILLVLNSNYL